MTRNRWLAGGAVVVGSAIAFFVVDYLLNAYRMERIPKNFATVKAGVLYRSGQMRPEHLERVLREHGVKTLVCLNPGTADYEEPLARRVGVRYVSFDMPGSGEGKPEYFHEYLRLLANPENRPVLVHCSAGAYRTGAAVALYRMVFQGWSLDNAVREMRYHGFWGEYQEDLIAHVRKVYDSIPDRDGLARQVASKKEESHAR